MEELRGAWESGGVRHGERGTLGTVDPRGNPGIFKRLGEEMGSSAKDQENLGDLSGDWICINWRVVAILKWANRQIIINSQS